MALAGLFSPRWAAGCVSSAAAAPVAHSAHPMPGSIARLPSPRAPPSALRSAPTAPRPPLPPQATEHRFRHRAHTNKGRCSYFR